MFRDGIELCESHPNYGEIIIDSGGLLVCHICGKGGYRALGHHVRQVHLDVVPNMRAYKIMFGLNVKKGILIEETRKIKADAVWNNETVLNLYESGESTRFKKGSSGRTRDKLSEQEKRVLAHRAKYSMHHGFLNKGIPNNKK